jgi:hypothetical protein
MIYGVMLVLGSFLVTRLEKVFATPIIGTAVELVLTVKSGSKFKGELAGTITVSVLPER